MMLHGPRNLCWSSTMNNNMNTVTSQVDWMDIPLDLPSGSIMSSLNDFDSEKLFDIDLFSLSSLQPSNQEIFDDYGSVYTGGCYAYENIADEINQLTVELRSNTCDACLTKKGLSGTKIKSEFSKADFICKSCGGNGYLNENEKYFSTKKQQTCQFVSPKTQAPLSAVKMESYNVAPGTSLLRSKYNTASAPNNTLYDDTSSDNIFGHGSNLKYWMREEDHDHDHNDSDYSAANPNDLSIDIYNLLHKKDTFKECALMDAMIHDTDSQSDTMTLNAINAPANIKQEIKTETYLDLEKAISECDFNEVIAHDMFDFEVKEEVKNDEEEEEGEDEEMEEDEELGEEEEEEDEDEEEYEGSPSGESASSYQTVASDLGPINDHCYTMRSGMDTLGVQTPSDSEEDIEIDVVGDGIVTNLRDKIKLPTNLNNNNLQELERKINTAVAEKIKPSRVVKQPGGIRTLPPRRSTQEKETKKAPAPTKPKKAAPAKRKRKRDCDDDEDEKPARKPRKKRSKRSDTESDLDEKRNLHNDMERQRRVGLRHLFAELKEELPDLKEKERAPKVLILQRATALCNVYNRLQSEYEYIYLERTRLQNRLRKLRYDLFGHRQRRDTQQYSDTKRYSDTQTIQTTYTKSKSSSAVTSGRHRHRSYHRGGKGPYAG